MISSFINDKFFVTQCIEVVNINNQHFIFSIWVVHVGGVWKTQISRRNIILGLNVEFNDNENHKVWN